jgi:signal recognition particle subunit SRP54
MFDALTEKLSGLVSKLRFKAKLTERNVADACEEVRIALLEADVNYAVAREFVNRVKDKALGLEVIQGVDPGQQFVKVVYDEMIALLGPTDSNIHFRPKGITVIMMAGLQGSGKTTTAAKLAVMLKKRGRKPMLAAADVQRPAAIEQLKRLGESIDVPFFAEQKGKPEEICTFAIKIAEAMGLDTVILDTAGRLHVDEDLMQEVERISAATMPSEIFLVVDAMTGQDAVTSAKEFNERLEVSGLILTKLDGDARGGAALSIKAVSGKPVKFVGMGEKTDALEPFHPERMAGRILGMGDVVSLVEKAQEKIDQNEARRLQERMFSQQFTLEDMLQQFRQVRKLGSLKDTLAMIPGLSAMAGPMDVDEREFARFEATISSMTPEERAHPELVIDASRRNRIAKGSGTSPNDVMMLLKQYREIRKLFSGKGKLSGMFQGLLGNMGMKLPGMKSPAAGAPAAGTSPFGPAPSPERRAELRQQWKKERRQKKRNR